jgi:hypothetical protein
MCWRPGYTPLLASKDLDNKAADDLVDVKAVGVLADTKTTVTRSVSSTCTCSSYVFHLHLFFLLVGFSFAFSYSSSTSPFLIPLLISGLTGVAFDAIFHLCEILAD